MSKKCLNTEGYQVIINLTLIFRIYQKAKRKLNAASNKTVVPS